MKHKKTFSEIDFQLAKILFQNQVMNKKENKIYISEDLERSIKIFVLKLVKSIEKKNSNDFFRLVRFLDFCFKQIQNNLLD